MDVDHDIGTRRSLLASGVSWRQLSGRRWESPAHGVHAPSGSITELRGRCAAIALALPDDACFSHVTGAGLRGWWLPGTVDPSCPLIASTPTGTAHLDRRGVYARRLLLPAADRQRLGGVSVASAAHLLRELAEDFSLIDLVVALDCALHLGQLSTADLIRLPRRGRRGVRALRRAIALCDGRSESFWETVLRLVHVLSGITAVTPQHVLVDGSGHPVARADLWLRGTNRIHEYDGAEHRDRARHRADLGREKALSRLRIDRYGYTRPEIVYAADAIVRDAEQALGMSHDPARVDGWMAEFQLSSLSRPGLARLHRRLERFRRPEPPRALPTTPSPTRRVAQEAPLWRRKR